MNMTNQLVPIEVNNQRILTTQQLAEVYETDTNNIKNNFANHKSHFVEGVHYFLLKGEELKAFKREVNNIGLSTQTQRTRSMILTWLKRKI